jgi:hypothetical protein
MKNEISTGERAIEDVPSFDRVIKGCSETLQRLHPLIERLIPLKSDSKTTRLRKAIKSLKHESEVSKVWAEVESYKTSLILHFVQRSSTASSAVQNRPATNYTYPNRLVTHYVDRSFEGALLSEQIEAHITVSSNRKTPLWSFF